MSRYQVPVPPTSQYTVVFPLDAWAKQYDASFYNPGLTDGRAHNEEINQVLREVERIRKPFQSKAVCALWLYILSLLACVCLMVVVPITAPSGYDSYYGTYTDNTASIIAAIIGGMIGVFVVMIIFIVYVKHVVKMSRVPVQEYLNQVNANFVTRGLRWHLPVHFPRWIELWKDYVGQAQTFQPVGQTAYIPPQQYQPYGAPAGAHVGGAYQAPGSQPQDYQNYGQPQGYVNYTQGQQNFQNYTPNQA